MMLKCVVCVCVWGGGGGGKKNNAPGRNEVLFPVNEPHTQLACAQEPKDRLEVGHEQSVVVASKDGEPDAKHNEVAVVAVGRASVEQEEVDHTKDGIERKDGAKHGEEPL
jgi:hypothetical protein